MPVEHQHPFSLRQLAYFREVARRLHFRRAAEALAIAQPALSRAVAQLETVTQQNAALVEQSASAAMGLRAIWVAKVHWQRGYSVLQRPESDMTDR